jgi:hypothetical protein
MAVPAHHNEARVRWIKRLAEFMGSFPDEASALAEAAAPAIAEK